MSLQMACPRCHQLSSPSIRVATREVAASTVPDSRSSRQAWRVPLVLILSLTIVGLPIAYWLVKRFECMDANCQQTMHEYTCQCSRCGHRWSWQAHEPIGARSFASDLLLTRFHIHR